MAEELTEFELMYVARSDIPKREAEGWRSVSKGRMGTHAEWSVLMRRDLKPIEEIT